jgi:hypothetical protein
MNNDITNLMMADPAMQRLNEIIVNIDQHAAKVIPFHEPKPAQPAAPRDKIGRMITPAEIVLFGEGMAADRYESMLRATAIDAAVQYDRPPVLFTFDGHPLLTMQNISVISGKAKSRKSGFASVLAAMTLNPNSNRTDWQRLRGQRLQAERPYQRAGVLLFDTEQAQYHAWAMTRRILYMADRDDNSGNMLRTFALRDFNPADRLQFIAETIERHAHECSLVIIDGVRDVVMNINSEDEATLMNSWLLTITKRHNIHITCVLHENKGTDTLRGHIGTELQNKAEAVFTVTKGTTKATRDISAVETSVSRNKGMERIGMDTIEIERDGGLRLWIPALTDDGRAERIGKAAEGMEQADDTIREDQHREILRAIWGDNTSAEITAADLLAAVRAHAAVIIGRPISERIGRDIMAHWHSVVKWIDDNGKATKGRMFSLRDQSAIGIQDRHQPQNPNIVMDFGAQLAGNDDDVPF